MGCPFSELSKPTDQLAGIQPPYISEKQASAQLESRELVDFHFFI